MSAMASSKAGGRRRDFPAPVSRSRTTSDFDSFRRRDSASISATTDSGNRTVNVFIAALYYIAGIYAIHQLPWPRGLVRIEWEVIRAVRIRMPLARQP